MLRMYGNYKSNVNVRNIRITERQTAIARISVCLRKEGIIEFQSK